MSFEIEGRLHKKFDTESKTDTFQAREFVIETANGSYSQFIKFQLVQDRCAIVDNFNEGDTIKVHFDLRGREWNGKYFTNLNAWRVEGAGAAPAASPAENAGDFPSIADAPSTDEVAGDDLPF